MRRGSYIRCLIALFGLALPAGNALAGEDGGQCPGGKPTAEGRPVVGLVLSGGGARGAAHVGVLRVIEELDIPVDLVVGTSMGGIVGALYASGTPVDEIDAIVRRTDWPNVLSDGPPYRELSLSRKREKRDFQLGGRLGVAPEGVRLPSGLREGQNVRLMLRAITRHVADLPCFHDYAIPFAAVATDAGSGATVVLTQGDIVDVLRATMAIPAWYSPVRIDDRLLVDGGSANNMPVTVARQMGADVVIAVDISTPFTEKEKLRSLFSISMQMTTMLARRAADEERLRLTANDVLIVPDLANVETLDFEEMPEAIAAGEQAARAWLSDWRWRGKVSAPERPAARFAQRYAAARHPALLRSVSTRGDSKLPAKQITDRFALQPGDRIDDGTLRKAVTRVYGLDYFATVDYRRLSTPEGDDIVLELRDREWGPTYLQFGLGFYDNFEGINHFSLGASLTATQVNRLTGQFRLQGTLGDTQRLFSEFHQPVTIGAALFVAPWALLERHGLDAWLGGTPVAHYRAGTEEGGLDLGWAGRHGEIRLGYGLGSRKLERLIGAATLPSFSSNTGYLRIDGELDRLDERDFPSRGGRLQVLAEYGRPGLGSDDDFDRLVVDGSIVHTFGRQHLMLAVNGEFLDVAGSMLLEPPHSGGAGAMSAFNPGELIGDNVASLRLATYRRVNRLPLLKVYIGGGLEYGGAWNGAPTALNSKQLWPVALGFAGVATPLGPVYLVGGLSENGHRALHLQLGYRF